MASSLTLRAGPTAHAIIRERGLRAEDVDVLPGASGGAKWLSIAGLDRFLFGEFLQAPRIRPMHLIGSSIGSWRMACLAQRDPVAALERGHNGYIYGQRYSPKPSPREVTRVSLALLDDILGPYGVDEILAHPWAKLHVITAMGTGFASTDRRWSLMMALAISATANFVSRRWLALQMKRFVFHSSGSDTAFLHLSDLPTTHLPLTRPSRSRMIAANIGIGAIAGGVSSLVRGKPIARGLIGGATGGLIVFGGKCLIGQGRSATDWVGRATVDVGSSIIVNTSSGEAPFRTIGLAVGPLHVSIGSKHVIERVSVDVPTLVAATYFTTREGSAFDLRESLRRNALVVVREPGQGNRAIAGTLYMSRGFTIDGRAHELTHVAQSDMLGTIASEPIEKWALSQTNWGKTLHRFVDLGVAYPLWAIANRQIEHDRRPWETEARFFAKGC
jgi:pimeloyl-ACP methyl ester carboxylesterase